jgi:hypothetical protein
MRTYSEDEVKLILEDLRKEYSRFYKSDSPWGWETPFEDWVNNILKK